MNNIGDETPKHRKKKESSVSKSKEKSKHKHEFKEYLLITMDDDKPHKASCCKICGKISGVKFCEGEKTEHGTYRMLHSEEIYEKYKNLEKVYILYIFQKYIPINRG